MRRDNRDSRSGGGGRDRSFGGGRDRGFGGGGRRFGGRDDGPKQMFPAVCSDCGKACEVPFRPTNGKPVYCSDCFGQSKGRDDDRGGRSFGDSRRDSRDNRGGGANGSNVGAAVLKGQFDALNAKLDKILAVLTNTKTGEEPKKDVLKVKKVEKVAKKEKKTVKKVVKKATSKKPKTKKK